MTAEGKFAVLVTVLNKLTDNISDCVTKRLPHLIEKLLLVLKLHTRGQKCTKVTTLQILRKLLAIYLTEQELKEGLVEVLRRNLSVLVEELLLSKAHSSLHLSAVLSVLLILRRCECTDLLERIVSPAVNSSVMNCVWPRNAYSRAQMFTSTSSCSTSATSSSGGR